MSNIDRMHTDKTKDILLITSESEGNILFVDAANTDGFSTCSDNDVAYIMQTQCE